MQTFQSDPRSDAANRETVIMDLPRSEAENQIHRLIDGRIRAIRTKDIDALMVGYAPQVLIFDAVTALQESGVVAVRKRLGEWFTTYRGGIGYEVRNLVIVATEELAFAHSLDHVTGTMQDGKQVDMWVRATVCYRKLEGAWRIVHEHISAPFDAESGAMLVLEPE